MIPALKDSANLVAGRSWIRIHRPVLAALPHHSGNAAPRGHLGAERGKQITVRHLVGLAEQHIDVTDDPALIFLATEQVRRIHVDRAGIREFPRPGSTIPTTKF